VETVRLGLNDEPAFNEDGSHRRLFEYASDGSWKDTLELGPNGRFMNNKHGWARRRDLLSPKGETQEYVLYKLDSARQLRMWKRLDRDDNELELWNLDQNGRPRTWPAGHHRFVSRFDGRGRFIEARYFRLDGEKATPSWGYHIKRRRYDDRDRLVEEAFFSVDGEPVVNAEGSCRTLHRYGERSLWTEVTELGVNGRPRNNKQGWARRHVIFTSPGVERERIEYKADPQGVVRLWRRFDVRANTDVERHNMDESGRPRSWPEGHHSWTTKLNSRGQFVEARYFGLDGEKVTPWGHHLQRRRLDGKDRVLEVAFFGVNGEPVLDSRTGSFRRLYRYDAGKDWTECLELGYNGRPRNNSSGWAKQVRIFDKSQQLTKSVSYKADAAGHLTELPGER
jgi:hypothetical protein